MNTGLRLKKIREKKGCSGKALAETVGVVPSQISKIENGVTNPSIDLLERICFALGITMAEFFTDDPVDKPASDDVSSSDLALARKIKNLAPDKREIVETVIKVDEASKDEQTAAEGK